MSDNGAVDTITISPTMSLEERMMRVDTLLCVLFSGLVAHPLATTLIPPDELAKLRALLPQE